MTYQYRPRTLTSAPSHTVYEHTPSYTQHSMYTSHIIPFMCHMLYVFDRASYLQVLIC